MKYRIKRSDSLYHHGILGMKWGRRNGPPYPLSPGDHSQSEKKAGWHKSLDGRNEDLYDRNKKGLSDKQRKILKGTAITAGTILATYGVYKLSQTGEVQRIGKEFIQNADLLGAPPNLKSMTKNDISELISNKNPSNSRTNCGSCAVVAFEATQGNNFKAVPEVPYDMRIVLKNGKLGNGFDPEKLTKAYKGSKIEQASDLFDFYYDNKNPNEVVKKKVLEKVQQKLESLGDGAGGLIWSDTEGTDPPRGHYTAWRIINDKLHILESQINDGLVFDNFYDDIGRIMDPNTLRWSRLDGLEKNESVFNKIVNKG